MLTFIIALLMSLNLISSPTEYNSMSEADQTSLTEIIIDDQNPGIGGGN